MIKINNSISNSPLTRVNSRMLLGSRSEAGSDPLAGRFVMSVKTDNTGTSNDDQFSPTIAAGTYNGTWYWGDGTSTAQTDAVSPTHTYLDGAGTYTVSYEGVFAGMAFSAAGDAVKLLDIVQWGDIAWQTFDSAFRGCSGLTTLSATDAPDLSSVTSMSNAFRTCSGLTALDFSGWDTSNISNFVAMFFQCSSLASTGAEGWDTSSATAFNSLFGFCTALDIDVSAWPITSLSSANDMFASSGFTQTNYDLLLVAWEAQVELANVTFSAGTAKYGAGAPATAKGVLEAAPSLWIITDGGAA